MHADRHQPNRVRKRDHQVPEDQPGQRVDKPESAEVVEQSDPEDDLRHDEGRHDQRGDQTLPRKAIPSEGVSRQGPDRQ